MAARGGRGKGGRRVGAMSTGVSVHVQGCKRRRAAGEMQEQRDPDDRGGGGRAIGSGRAGGRGPEGKAAGQADLFSPNVRGFLMKMSTLLGIFQDPDADLPLPASPPHPV